MIYFRAKISSKARAFVLNAAAPNFLCGEPLRATTLSGTKDLMAECQREDEGMACTRKGPRVREANRGETFSTKRERPSGKPVRLPSGSLGDMLATRGARSCKRED